MSASTPLDTLKHTVLRADDLLALAVHSIASTDGPVTDEHPAFEILDALRAHLYKSLSEQLPGVRWWDGEPQTTPEGKKSLRTYSDGSPVVEFTEQDGVQWKHYPRLDKSLPAPRPRLRLVPQSPDPKAPEGNRPA